MRITRKRAEYMPTVNSYFVEDITPQARDIIIKSRERNIGGDKYLRDKWEVSKEVYSLLSCLPHEFIDMPYPILKPLVLTIDKNDPLGMYHYQDIAAEELRKRKNALLFFDTGTGKTRTSLLALSALTKEESALIVTGESNLVDVWYSQVKEHFPEFAERFVLLNQNSVADKVDVVKQAPEGSIFVIGIHSLRLITKGTKKRVESTRAVNARSLIEALNSRNLAVTILDECQCIIGSTSQQTTGLNALKSEFRWALSATPIKNSPLEWQSLLAWLRLIPDEGMKTRFCQYYAYQSRNRFGGIVYTSFRNEDDLEDLKNLITIRVEKKGLELPERHIRQFIVDTDDDLEEVRSIVKKEKRKDWVDAHIEVGTREFHADNVSSLFYIERIATAIAYEKVDFIMHRYLNKDEQFIVVSCLKYPLEYFHRMMANSVLYHGDIPESDRRENLRLFKEGKIKVLLMTRQSGGVGLTLTNAHTMIFLDAPENEANFNQCADRIHRIGQKDEVDIFIPKVKNSLDEYAWQHLKEKQSWIDRYFKTNYEGE